MRKGPGLRRQLPAPRQPAGGGLVRRVRRSLPPLPVPPSPVPLPPCPGSCSPCSPAWRWRSRSSRSGSSSCCRSRSRSSCAACTGARCARAPGWGCSWAWSSGTSTSSGCGSSASRRGSRSSLFMTLWFALLGAALAAVSRLRWWPLWSALVWVAIEVLSGAYPMSGFTWGRLVFATIDTPYAGWLPWVGANGVSLLVALTASVLAWLALRLRSRWAQRERRDALVAGGVLVATAAAVVLPGLRHLVGGGRRHRPDRDRPGRRARQRRRPARLQPRGHPQPHRPDPRPGRRRRRRPRRAPRLRRLAGELHRDGPVPRRGDPVRAEEHHRGPAGADPRGRRRRRPRGRRGAQPGHRLRPRAGRRRPLHQAAPGAVRRVHPLPREARHRPQLQPALPGAARHAQRHPHQPAADRRHPGGRRDLLRRVLRRRDRRAGARGSGAAHRADLQRVLHPHRPDRAAVRDEPAPGPRDRADGRDRLGQRPQRLHRTGRHRPGRDRAPHPGGAGPGRPAGPGGPAVHGGRPVAGPGRRAGRPGCRPVGAAAVSSAQEIGTGGARPREGRGRPGTGPRIHDGESV